MAAALKWEVDSRYPFWLRAPYSGTWLYVRLNRRFPDEPLYSLLVDIDETFDFDDFPEEWERVGALEWPGDDD